METTCDVPAHADGDRIRPSKSAGRPGDKDARIDAYWRPRPGRLVHVEPEIETNLPGPAVPRRGGTERPGHARPIGMRPIGRTWRLFWTKQNRRLRPGRGPGQPGSDEMNHCQTRKRCLAQAGEVRINEIRIRYFLKSMSKLKTKTKIFLVAASVISSAL